MADFGHGYVNSAVLLPKWVNHPNSPFSFFAAAAAVNNAYFQSQWESLTVMQQPFTVDLQDWTNQNNAKSNLFATAMTKLCLGEWDICEHFTHLVCTLAYAVGPGWVNVYHRLSGDASVTGSQNGGQRTKQHGGPEDAPYVPPFISETLRRTLLGPQVHGTKTAFGLEAMNVHILQSELQITDYVTSDSRMDIIPEAYATNVNDGTSAALKPLFVSVEAEVRF